MTHFNYMLSGSWGRLCFLTLWASWLLPVRFLKVPIISKWLSSNSFNNRLEGWGGRTFSAEVCWWQHSFSLPLNPLPARTHRASCHWHPGSGGMSPQTASPRGTPQRWWWRRWWWNWAGRWSRRRSSSGSGRTNTARSRRAWTTAGWSATQSRAMTSAPGNGCSWRTCAPKYTLPTVGLSYSGTVKDGVVQTFPFPLSSSWCVRRELLRPTEAELGILYHESCWALWKKGNIML